VVGAAGDGAEKPALCRGALGALAEVGELAFGAATGRGATIGRAAKGAACDAAPGIIGRGGKRTGRLTAPALGAGPLGVGGSPACFTTVGAASATAAGRSCGSTAARELGAGVGARGGLGGGANVSTSAAASP